MGKSTAIKHLEAILDEHLESIPEDKQQVIFTKEPSDSQIGKFVRSTHEDLFGESLALLIAADRAEHIKRVIQPNLDAGKVVISDRYIPSSMVLQQIDGVGLESILKYNSAFPVPDLSIIINSDIQTLFKRVQARSDALTRFENPAGLEKEVTLYESLGPLLSSIGFKVLYIDSTSKTSQEVAQIISTKIINLST